MFLVGYCHHKCYNQHGICHHTDRTLCWILIAYTSFLNASKYYTMLYWCCLIMVGLAYAVTFNCDYNDDVKRNWDNIGQLLPHMCMHIFAGVGISFMLLKKKSM